MIWQEQACCSVKASSCIFRSFMYDFICSMGCLSILSLRHSCTQKSMVEAHFEQGTLLVPSGPSAYSAIPLLVPLGCLRWLVSTR